MFLAATLEQPLLLEGEAGVGKTEVARALAALGGRAADPAAVPRGHRPPPRGLRLGLPAPAAGDPRRRGGRRGARAVRARVPAAAPAAGGARARRPGGAADRRGRPRRRRVRGVPARVPRRLRDHDPGARHGDGAAPAARRADLQPHARAARRAQAPLPVPLDRLPDRASARPRSSARGCPACPRRSPSACARPSRGCARRSSTSCRAWGRRSRGRGRCWRSTAPADLEGTLGVALKVREDIERVRERGVLGGA